MAPIVITSPTPTPDGDTCWRTLGRALRVLAHSGNYFEALCTQPVSHVRLIAVAVAQASPVACAFGAALQKSPCANAEEAKVCSCAAMQSACTPCSALLPVDIIRRPRTDGEDELTATRPLHTMAFAEFTRLCPSAGP